MTLKSNWANGEQFNASDANAVAEAVNAAYVKPGTGIPASDLASAVQTSLGKADTAVQSVSSTNITDATTTGKALITTTDASTARTTLGVAYGTTAGTVCQGNDSRLSPTSNSITDATTVGKALLTATDAATARTTLGTAYGTTSTTVCVGNDSRLSDTRNVANTNTVTVKAANLTIQDGSDTTKQAQFAASGITTGTTRTYTLPNASTTLVGTDTTQTLTNKTFTDPKINSILDTSGAVVANISPGGSVAMSVGGANHGMNINTTATDTGWHALFCSRTGSTGSLIGLYYGASSTLVGNITTNGTTTTYGTSSDYRLKENVEPLSGGITTIAQLSPVKYQWISNGDYGEGFLAHELQEVIPEAVYGDKDAVDVNGNIEPQSVDLSKIVPHLVVAFQELTVKLEAAEARIAALEAR